MLLLHLRLSCCTLQTQRSSVVPVHVVLVGACVIAAHVGVHHVGAKSSRFGVVEAPAAWLLPGPHPEVCVFHHRSGRRGGVVLECLLVSQAAFSVQLSFARAIMTSRPAQPLQARQ
jgi:hypothetical protein